MTYFFVLLVGLAFGSFITMASYRLPRGEDIVRKPSHCTSCSAKLTFFDLWPVLSWLLSGAKCRHCKAPVSIRYPLIEMITAAIFLLIDIRYGLTPMAFVLALMAVALLIMIVVDLEHYLIPDQVHVMLLPLAIAFHYLKGTPWMDVIIGGLLGGGLALLLHYGYRWIRKRDGLGFGDVKFFAVAGVWLTYVSLAPFLFIAGLLGVVTGLLWRLLGKGRVFPFGPALAVSLFLCVAFPEITKLFWNMELFLK